MSSAGAQAVVAARPPLPCGWACRPSAWASIGLIWAISSCALRKSWNGSPRLMGRGGPLARGGRRPGRADQRSLAELNYVHSTVNTVHLSRSAFNRGDGAAAAGPHPRKPVMAASGDYRYRPELALAVYPPSTTRAAAAPKLTLPPGGGRGAGRPYRQ